MYSYKMQYIRNEFATAVCCNTVGYVHGSMKKIQCLAEAFQFAYFVDNELRKYGSEMLLLIFFFAIFYALKFNLDVIFCVFLSS